jgi:hypothetical protein
MPLASALRECRHREQNQPAELEIVHEFAASNGIE